MKRKIDAIVFDKSFEKKFEDYKDRLDGKRLGRLRDKIEIFRKNAFDARLHTHKLGGKLKDYWVFSITSSDRIMFRFLTANKVFFIDIGDHKIYEV